MRRNAIADVLKDSIPKHFPDDVARQFNLNDLDDMARTLQDRDVDNDTQIDGLVEIAASSAPGRVLDEIADGDMRDPNEWLTTRLRVI